MLFGDRFVDKKAPANFLCPITQEVMTHPVCTEDGQTFEKSSIEKWLADGNRKSPTTGQTLRDTKLTTNYALRNSIEEWTKAELQTFV